MDSFPNIFMFYNDDEDEDDLDLDDDDDDDMFEAGDYDLGDEIGTLAGEHDEDPSL